MSRRPQKIELFEILEALDKNGKPYYDLLNEEQQKSFEPWLMMRYASSCNDYPEHYLLLVNDLVNENFSTLSKHPKLVWLLLTMCGVGKKQRHPWIKPPKKKKIDRRIELFRQYLPEMKDDEIEALLTINTKDQIKQHLIDFGIDDKEMKETMKVLYG